MKIIIIIRFWVASAYISHENISRNVSVENVWFRFSKFLESNFGQFFVLIKAKMLKRPYFYNILMLNIGKKQQ